MYSGIHLIPAELECKLTIVCSLAKTRCWNAIHSLWTIGKMQKALWKCQWRPNHH